MVKEVVHDPMLLAQKSIAATKEDTSVVTDLMDTLKAYIEGCVGMAANMIGVQKKGVFPCPVVQEKPHGMKK